jgi:hypothetical protein
MRTLCLVVAVARRTVAFGAVTMIGCGSSTPPPKEPDPEPAATSRPVRSDMKTSSELGTIDPNKAKDAFRALYPKFTACQKGRLGDIEVLAGNVNFFVRIGADGTTKWTYLLDSDLGDRETEKCLIDVVKSASWPKPDGGGDAEVQYSFELPQNASRDAVDWSVDKIAHLLGPVEKCKAGSSATYKVTAYVAEGGKVIGVGVAAPEKDADDKIDCMVKAVKKLKPPSPGAWPAKVSFKL